ncbi:MAG: MFS transporter [Chloroflexota bacterium]|nr:MFS transporter [Chloroflexota bacterium]
MSRSAAAPRVWQHADFLKLLAGETVSDLGSQVGDLALPFAAALVLNATPGQMAALRAAEYVPRILVGLVAGVWIDRLPRRRVLIATNVVRALLLLGVAAIAAMGLLRMEFLYPAGILMSTLGVVFGIALPAYLPSLVPPRLLVAGNSARATCSAATEVIGPGLAGILIQVLGVPAAVALDGVSFLASVTGTALIRTPEPAPASKTGRRRLAVELVEGVHTLIGNPILRAFQATAIMAQFFYSVIMAVYVLYLTRDLGLSPSGVGLIFGLGGGVGVLVGSAAAAGAARLFGLGRTLVLAHLLFGVFGIFLAFTVVWRAHAALLVFASEFAQLSVNAVYMVNRSSVEQGVTPPGLRGRVQASRMAAHAASGTLGILLGGVLGEQFGTGTAILVGVVGGLLSFVWLWRSPIRGLEVFPEAAD